MVRKLGTISNPPPRPRSNIAIVGASVRAIAESARSAGFAVVGLDLFGDTDLRRVADRVYRLDPAEYPEGVLRLAASMNDVCWCYTGGIENHPRVVAGLAVLAPLWGNDATVLRSVRNPFELSDGLRADGFPFPATHRSASDADRKRQWLVKSPLSTGGGQVRFWNGRPLTSGSILQEFIPGTSCSAVYAASSTHTALLGASRQHLARDIDAETSTPFRYVGSVGPLSFAAEDRLVELGQCLSQRFGLRGLFGVDFQYVADDIWPIEVNPRYPASAEVIERAKGLSMFACHAACFDTSDSSGHLPPCNPENSPIVAKRILFAPRDGQIHPDAPCFIPRSCKQFADVPSAGTRIRQGAPVLTIFESGTTEAVATERVQLSSRSFLERWFVP